MFRETLIVFDVDGTLVGGEPTDWAASMGPLKKLRGSPWSKLFGIASKK
jgi:phosphoserine phosphatase